MVIDLLSEFTHQSCACIHYRSCTGEWKYLLSIIGKGCSKSLEKVHYLTGILNIFAETHNTNCRDNQSLYEIISNDIKQNGNTGIELNTLQLYKKVVNIGQRRLRSYRLYLANTFKLMETGDIEIDDQLTENDLKNLWQIVLESKEWYSKLKYLERQLKSVHIILPKEKLVKQHGNTLLATIRACSGSMDNLSEMLTLNQEQ